MPVNHEYERGGALACLAACDVHRARVIGLCSDTTGIGPFTDLVDEVMTQEPYASARREFWRRRQGPGRRVRAGTLTLVGCRSVLAWASLTGCTFTYHGHVP